MAELLARAGLARLPPAVAAIGPRLDTVESIYDVRPSAQLEQQLQKLRAELEDRS